MALFTDAEIVTLDDLLQFETSLVQVASSHGINVDTKIKLATDAVSDKLLLWLLRAGASDPQYLKRRLLGLSTVVVTPVLQRWVCFESLSRFFAEAYNVQLNTRFQGKWTEYQNEAAEASDLVFMSGLGIVYNPLPRPAMPLVSIQNGTSPAFAMFIETTWVDSRGTESAVSPVNGLILNGASTIAVAMAEGALNAPSAAVGWNVYAGTTEDQLTRQNTAPLQIGSTWQLPGTGLVDGPEASGGQQPNYYIVLPRLSQRG
ncbi:MAG: hypothetical protein JOY62_18690 [Acidobacteriaceae bacterium]|nr:hypothetical protein [Acidobacteriaceae bacterium]MBV9781996.1 hypothetical protein [Acidobacteriaceae bacterium]